MFSLSIIFIDQDSEGEICALCKKEIKGKKWIMFLDFGDPAESHPYDDKPFCTICKVNFEKGD